VKLAFIFPEFVGPYGGERHIINAINKMCNKNTVDLFTPKITKEWKKVLDKRVKLNQVGNVKSPFQHLRTLMQLFWLRRVKLKKNYDYILCFQWQTVYAGSRNKSKGKIIYFCNEQPVAHAYSLRSSLEKILVYPGFKIADTIFRIALRNVNFVVSNSEWNAKTFKKYYGMKSIVINPGIEVKRFKRFNKEKCKKKLKLESDVYASVSQLTKRKQVDKVILHYNKIKKKNKQLLIIGKGVEENNLKELVKRKNVENVKFLGEIKGDLLVKYLRAANYFIFLSKDEPFGIAPLEAKAAGCKIIPKDHKQKISTWEDYAKYLTKTLEKNET